MLKGALDQEERSWVTSLFAISGVVGTLFYYSIADILGRKIGLCSIAFPHAVSTDVISASSMRFATVNLYL